MSLKLGLRRIATVASIMLPIIWMLCYESKLYWYKNKYHFRLIVTNPFDYGISEGLTNIAICIILMPVFYLIYLGLEKIVLWVIAGFKETKK